MSEKATPIILRQTTCSTINHIISPDQSREENNDKIKKAIDYLTAKHYAMLDGVTYDVSCLNAFVKKASSLCACDEEELMKYADDALNRIALPINL
ncbi:MAG: hypothetical protein IJ686_02220 [Bacteroidales bacterium]|nr:hypothetical protein [Bacteroidales bacterium]